MGTEESKGGESGGGGGVERVLEQMERERKKRSCIK